MRKVMAIPGLIVLLAALLLAAGLTLGDSLAAAEPEPATAAPAATEPCADSFCLNWAVLAGVAGGMAPMESDNFRLQSTLGQTMAGLFSGNTYHLKSGYWVVTLSEREFHIYLPAILRG